MKDHPLIVNLSNGHNETCSREKTVVGVKVMLGSNEPAQKNIDISLSNKRILKALIRLRECTDWSAPLLFACNMPGFVALRPIIMVYRYMLIQLLI